MIIVIALPLLFFFLFDRRNNFCRISKTSYKIKAVTQASQARVTTFNDDYGHFSSFKKAL